MSSPSLSLSPTPPLSPGAENTADPHDEDFHDPPTAPVANPTADIDNDISDADSVLSEVDEAQFEDFDPNQIAIEERPAIAVDEDTVKLIGRHKRKRADGELDGEAKKKKKEGRREKVKKSKKRKESDDEFSGGEQMQGKRARKRKAYVEGDEGARPRKERAKPRQRSPEDEEHLDPEERRRRALDRAMDLALKNPTKRRRRAGEVDLTNPVEDDIANLRIRMAEAAEADVQARQAVPPKPAMHKLKLLPEVTGLLNRNSREIESAVCDAETNLLESVRFFLEPLSDGSLPAYNIQRDLFASLARLPIDKESLISSALGKVVLFYTKSKKPEPAIKRAAERLLVEWTRPILKRSDDYRKRALPYADYDPMASQQSVAPGATTGPRVDMAGGSQESAREARERALAPPVKTNRARAVAETKTYTVVPRSGQVAGGMFARPLGASGEDAFRRMKARQIAATGGGSKKAR